MKLDRVFARAKALLEGPRIALHATLLAIVCTIPTLAGGTQIDDWYLQLVLSRDPHWPSSYEHWYRLFTFFDGDPARTHRFVDLGVAAWWVDPSLRLDFFRPVACATHWLDFHLWPHTPALAHAQSILWYALAVLLAAFAYRKVLGPTWFAGLAAVLYAIDHAHGLPVAWLAQRNAVIAGGLSFGALLVHLRGQRVLAALLFAVALLAGEAALAMYGYFIACALTLDRSRWPARLLGLLPSTIAIAAWAILYRTMHFGAHGSSMYVDPGADPLRFLKVASYRAPLNLSGELGAFPPELVSFMPTPVAIALVVVAAIVLAVAAFAFAPILRVRREARFFALGAIIAVIPTCATEPANRLTVVVGFGILGLIADLVRALSEKAVAPAFPRRAYATYAVCGHLFLSPLLLAGSAMQMGMVGDVLRRLARGVPDDPAIEHQRLVIVNPPDVAFTGYVPLLRWQSGAPTVPHSLLSLVNGTRPLDLTRTSATTFVVHAEGGVFRSVMDGLYRDVTTAPMHPGDVTEYSDLRVVVERVTDEGIPVDVRFELAKPLEDEQYRFMKVHDGELVPFEIPAIGASVHLDAEPIKF